MFGNCRLWIGLAGGSGHGRYYRTPVLWSRLQFGRRWDGLSVCLSACACVCVGWQQIMVYCFYSMVFQWKAIALHCFLWTCCFMLDGIVDTVKRHRCWSSLLWNGFWFGHLVSMLRSNYLDFEFKRGAFCLCVQILLLVKCGRQGSVTCESSTVNCKCWARNSELQIMNCEYETVNGELWTILCGLWSVHCAL